MSTDPLPPRRRPPAPPSLSPEARAGLDAAIAAAMPDGFPADGDVAAWERHIAAVDERIRARLAPVTPDPASYRRETLVIDGVDTHCLRPTAVSPDAAIVLDLHGGGLIQSGGDLTWIAGAPAAVRRNAITWIPDYRMPPRHPFPAALDDALGAYRRALEVRPPSRIVVSGSSAGGNLAAALLHRARDAGLPMPAALVLNTPELDLTESGDTFTTLAGIDLLGSLAPVNRLYAAGHDLAHPYLSPLFGDVAGFPATYLQSGTRDLFLSNTVRMHRKLLAAGVDTELHVFEARPHGDFGGSSPEDLDVRDSRERFERRFTG